MSLEHRRPWDEFFLKIASVCADQSTCERRSVGAVLVKDKVILSTGFNGAPSGLDHCTEAGGCLRQQLGIPSGERHEICRGAHAEQNAINNAAKHGIRINGSTLYCTTAPCPMCSKSIVNSGIVKIVYVEGYPAPMSAEILKNIKVTQIKE